MGKIETIRGRTGTWACQLAMMMFVALWGGFGFVLGDNFGVPGWIFFLLLCLLMYKLPVIVLIEPVKEESESEN